MPTTTTYREVVNSVLSAVNQPELTAAEWADAVGNQRKAKRIVVECSKDMQGKIPDEHWQAFDEFLLYAPLTTGTVDSTVGAFVNFTALSVDMTAEFVNADPMSCWFNLQGETQWYRIQEVNAATIISLRNDHLDPQVYADPKNYQIVKIREDLPSDFRDMQDADRPFAGVDMNPSSVNGIIRRTQQYTSFITGEDPEEYAVGWDRDSAGTTTTGPHLYYWPIPETDRYYRLLYQRQHDELDADSSAENTVFDFPEDMIPQLKYRAKMVATLEISEDPQGAAIYGGLEADKRRDDQNRNISKNDAGLLRPDTGAYRDHYRNARRRSFVRLGKVR